MNKYKLLYLKSLLPEEKHLQKLSSVEIIVSPYSPIISGNQLICGFSNPINTHLYKPVYVSFPKGRIVCYCATVTVAKHIQKAWEEYLKVDFESKKPTNNYQHTFNLYEGLVDNLFNSVDIRDNVVLGRIDSFIAFLKLIYLKHTLSVSLDTIRALFIELEMHRLRHHLLSVHNDEIFSKFLSREHCDKLAQLNLDHQKWQGRYLSIQNVSFLGKKFTLVNLPWGQDLAYLLVSKLLKRRKSIKKLFLVGGVGCFDSRVNIDDIFIANTVVNESGNRLTFTNGFTNKLNEVCNSPSSLFTKRAVGGELLCVDSSLGHKETFSKNVARLGITAVDMESYGVVKALKEMGTSNAPFLYMIHYIMDLPLKGLGLGATYYNREFLEKLFSDFNRGKYFCFDWILNEI